MAMCRAALPHIKKSPAGRIINIGFLRSVFAADGADAWRPGRAESCRPDARAGGRNRRVRHHRELHPAGRIMTPASRDVFRKDKALRDFCISRSAAQRLGEPVDVAKVALFLASDDAVFVSGTGIAVDGGRSGD